jgi:hypothetical protein
MNGDSPDPPKKKEPAQDNLPAIVEPDTAGKNLAHKAQAAGVPIPAKALGKLEAFMQAAKFGHQASLPMKCKGMSCPLIDMCPLHAVGSALPLAKACPVEGALVDQWVDSYISALNVDMDDPEQAVDIHMIYEIAGLELLRNRAAHHLANNPELIKTEIVGYSPQGDPIYDDKPSMALLIMEKQAKTMGKLRESILATRKAQAQVGQMAGDVSVRTATIMAKAQKILEERKKGGTLSEISETEFQILEDGEKQDV